MKHAALIPYFRGHYVLSCAYAGAIVDGSGAELGEMKERASEAVARGALPLERAITAEDIASATAAIVAWLLARDVDRLTIEAPGSSGAGAEHATRLLDAVSCALDGTGIACNVAPGAPAGLRDDSQARTRFLLLGIDAARSAVSAPVEPRHARMIAAMSACAPKPDDTGPQPAATPPAPPAPEVAPAPPDPKRPPAPPAPPAPDVIRLAGIDAGARHIAITIADLHPDAPALRHVISWTFAIDKPSDDELTALGLRLVLWLVRCGVVNVAVERATHFHAPDPERAGAVAAGLARGQWIAGALWGACTFAAPATAERLDRQWGVTLSVSSSVWRNDAKRRVKMKEWKAAVRALFAGTLPLVLGSDHALDSSGVVAWLAGMLAQETRAAAHVPREARAGKGDRTTKNQRQTAKRASESRARRDAAGCTCSGKKYHALSCAARALLALSLGPQGLEDLGRVIAGAPAMVAALADMGLVRVDAGRAEQTVKGTAAAFSLMPPASARALRDALSASGETAQARVAEWQRGNARIVPEQIASATAKGG